MKRKNFTTDLRRLLCALILVPACSFTLRAANITINSDPSSGVTLGTTITPSSTTDAVLNIDELIHQLGAGNVTVAATDGGKIIVADDLSWDSNYDLTLGDDATGSVEINASVTATGSGKFLIPDKKLKHVRISANKISTGGNQVYGNGYNPGLGTANSDTVYITGASGLALNASSGSITFDAYVRGSNKNLHSETASGQQTCFRNEVNDFADITVNGDVLLGGVRKWTLGISRTTPIPGKVGNSSNSVPDASTPTVETFTVTGKTSFYRGSYVNAGKVTLQDIQGITDDDGLTDIRSFFIGNTDVTQESVIGGTTNIHSFGKYGAGVLTVSDDKTIQTATTGTAHRITINEGILHLKATTSALNSYLVTVDARATLSGIGTVTATTNININGALSAGHGAALDGKGDIGTLFIKGSKTAFSKGTINADLGTGLTADLISVTGDVTFDASNPTTVNLNFPVGLPAGTYTILEATGTIKYGTDNKGVILGKIINLGHRLSTESAEIQYEQGALKIKLTASNRNLVWSAGTLDSKWHYSGSAVTDESNWILADDPYKDDRIAFLNNDFVTFSGAAPQTVDVDAAATVAGLTVSGGNYTFSNAQITGGASAAATGVLTVAGANTQATFNNALDFESCTVTGGATLILGNASNTFAGGVTVDGKLKLNHADALKSGDVTLQNGATLDLAHSGAGKYTIASLTATDNATLDFGNLNTLAVSGAADFTGGAVRLGITLAPGQTVDAIVADGSITGSTFTTGGNYMVEIVDGKILRISHLVATYGQTLADVPLPAGWTWDEPSTTPAGDVGTHTHTASRTDAPAVSGQPFSITVAPATLTFPVLQDTTVVSHEGNYLHDFPLLPGYAWAEPDRWIANCGTYELKVIYTHPSNNYKPVEGWVTVTIPCYAVPGSQKRQVFLPQVPGMTSNPPAGVHYVASGTDFIFTLTPQAPMQGLSRPSLTVETVPKTDVLITPQADGSYTVRIPVGIQNIQIKIQVNTLETANETVPTARVWAGDRTLYIAAATAGEARVYAVTGQLLKTLPHLAGETVTAQLPLGMYIVVAEGKAYKIMIGE